MAAGPITERNQGKIELISQQELMLEFYIIVFII